jgi:hypothetical protein
VVVNNSSTQDPGIGPLLSTPAFSFQNNRSITFLGTDGTIHSYNGLDGTHGCVGRFAPSSNFQLGAHWVHEGSLQFSTYFESNGKYMVDVQEFQPTSDPPIIVVKSFLVPPQNGKFSFSPVSSHASFVTKMEVVILDLQDSRILLQFATQLPYTSSGNFSLDGCFFACQTFEHEICIWTNKPSGYVPWCNLWPRLSSRGFSFSPTTSSILTWGLDGIQLLEPDNGPTILSTKKYGGKLTASGGVPISRGNHLVAYSADGAHIATVRQGDNIVTVLGTLPNIPQRLFDANLPILDIKIFDNTVFAANGHQLVSWNLNTGDLSEISEHFKAI